MSSRTGGSTFTNPTSYPAWKLIDEIDYRGKQLGGAKVSNLHSNFLINYKNASSLDLEMLGEEIKNKVWEKRKINLKWELIRIGEFKKKSEKILVLRGGISEEKEISVLTANQVYKTLQKKYDTTLIDVDNDCNKLINDLIKSKPDKVFNCLHGIFGEDGQLQSILNYLKIPYTHSGVLASSIAMNKVVSKYFYKALGIRFPKHFDINSKFTKSSYPFIIKPICGGSSKNLLKIENQKQLNDLKTMVLMNFINIWLKSLLMEGKLQLEY